MIKITSSKVVARKTIKVLLQKEIPPINEAIEKAMNNGDCFIYYRGEISKPTGKMLEKAGYVVENSGSLLDDRVKISWYSPYNKFSDNDAEVEKLAKELDLKIVEEQ